MKRAAICLVALTLMFAPALSESALTVNDADISVPRANAWMWLVKQSYSELTDYYSDTLGIDYWSLRYTSGMSVWDSVKADAFKQLVMMCLFSDIAREEGLNLSGEESALCREASLAAGGQTGFDEEDLYFVLRLRLLASKAYSYKLSFVDIDEESVAAAIDKDALKAYLVEYLYVPFYVYASNAAEYEKSLEKLRNLKDFEGDYGEVARFDPYFVGGTMTLCPARGDADETLLSALRTLGVGETSGPIETDYGLYMLRLVDDSDTSLYEEKLESDLLEERKRAYRAEYNRLYASAEYSLNAEYWDALKP